MDKLIEVTSSNVSILDELIIDDTVRPHLSAEYRVSNGRKVIILKNEEKTLAVCCVALGYGIPTNEDELSEISMADGSPVIVPYTIWSYESGSGRKLVNTMLACIKREYVMNSIATPYWPLIVTLSPKTEMAKRFHESNGAFLLAENEESYNFEYDLQSFSTIVYE